METPSDRQAYHSLAGAFRAPVQRRTLPVRERILLWLISTLLIFSTFAIGLRDLWAVQIALVLAGAAFLVAATRPADLKSIDPRAQRSGLNLLVRFPIFWMGLAILVYMAIQALNPQWAYRQNSLSWWLVRVPHVTWLPSGTEAPIGMVEGSGIPHVNAWWYVMFWSIPVLAVSALWAGVTRRHSCQLLAWVIGINAIAVVALGLAQEFTGAGKKVWWVYEMPGFPWGPFGYRNFTTAFLGLSSAVLIGLALNYVQERMFSARGQSPAAILGVLALVAVIGAGITGSRAGLVWSSAIVLCALPPTILIIKRRDPGGGYLVSLGLLGLVALIVGVVAIANLQPKRWVSSIDRFFRDSETSAYGRVALSRASAELLNKSPWTGVGAGGYRYHFPPVRRNDPGMRAYDKRFGESFVGNVHNDWLQYRIDLGRIGATLLLLPLGWWAWLYVRLRFWRSPILLMCAIGLSLSCLHALGEFIWQHGACLLLFSFVAALGGLWRTIEHETAARMREIEAASSV